MKVKDILYSKKEALEAHKKCCPYWHIQEKRQHEYGLSSKPVICGAGEKECNGKCWYMKTFRKTLKALRNE